MSKTYKTWEMIKELTKNPEKEFVSRSCTYGDRLAFVDDSGAIVQEDSCGNIITDTRMLNHSTITHREWKEVKKPAKPVTWQEAFKAGLEGKKIKPEGQHATYPDYEELYFALMYLGGRPGYYRDLMLGNWYIED